MPILCGVQVSNCGATDSIDPQTTSASFSRYSIYAALTEAGSEFLLVAAWFVGAIGRFFGGRFGIPR